MAPKPKPIVFPGAGAAAPVALEERLDMSLDALCQVLTAWCGLVARTGGERERGGGLHARMHACVRASMHSPRARAPSEPSCEGGNEGVSASPVVQAADACTCGLGAGVHTHACMRLSSAPCGGTARTPADTPSPARRHTGMRLVHSPRRHPPRMHACTRSKARRSRSSRCLARAGAQAGRQQAGAGAGVGALTLAQGAPQAW